jgi:TetR/AcrR family transcriptional repressor of nem operon
LSTLPKMPSTVKPRLLDAALWVIRAKGYSGMTVDDLCRAAQVTKGGFFHHFESKEALAIEAAKYFSAKADGLFSQAEYRRLTDPVDRLLGYVEFRKAILTGALPEFTCLLGTMVQETYETHPAIREACLECLGVNVAMVQEDVAEAMRRYEVVGEWSAESLAAYTQAVIQGAFILAKAKGGAGVAADCLDHLHRYLKMLFIPLQFKERRNVG